MYNIRTVSFPFKNILREILSDFHEPIRNRFSLRFYLRVTCILSLARISIHLIILIKEEKHIDKHKFSWPGRKIKTIHQNHNVFSLTQEKLTRNICCKKIKKTSLCIFNGIFLFYGIMWFKTLPLDVLFAFYTICDDFSQFWNTYERACAIVKFNTFYM